jgi:hypothetical protein
MDDHHLPPLAALTELAAPAHGWFRTRAAVERGVSRSTLTRYRRSGIVDTPRRDLNRLTTLPDSWDGRAVAALWSAGDRAALGRWAAVRVLLGRTTSPDIDVVVPRGVQPEDPVTPVRTSHRLTDADVETHGVLRATTAAFTLCDLAAVALLAQLVDLANRFLANEQLTVEALHAMVARFAWMTGVARARDLLAEVQPAGRWTRSDGERAWLRLIVAAGLPTPVANHRVVDADGRRRYLDFAYPGLRIGIEIDLHPTHGTTIGRRNDGARQNALVLQGWTILRFDLADLMLRPDLVARTVRAAIERAGA